MLFPLAELPAVRTVLTPEGYVAVYALGCLWAQLLLLVGLKGFHDRHNYAYGWPGTVGFYAIFVALALAFTGGAILITSLTFAGAESLVAYLTLIVSFVPLGLGSALLGLGITGVMRDPPSQLAGLLLAIGVPLGLLVAFAAGTNADFSFWSGLTMPYGLAWILLGVPLASERYGG